MGGGRWKGGLKVPTAYKSISVSVVHTNTAVLTLFRLGFYGSLRLGGSKNPDQYSNACLISNLQVMI